MCPTNEPERPPAPSRPPGTRLSISPEVISAEVDGALVLLDAKSGVYYSLNSIGARLWALAAAGATLGSIADTLLGEYEVERDLLWRDLETVIDELSQNALVEVLPDNE